MKKSILSAVLLLFFLPALFGCQSNSTQNPSRDILFQYSTLDALQAGVFDGDLTFGELKKQGDFGFGTFNALDGEMVQLDHAVYQIKSDGSVHTVSDDAKTPFAVVTFFEPDQHIPIAETMRCDALQDLIDKQLPTLNLPYAIRINGTFQYLKTRSVPKQNKPYPTLAQVVESQPIFEFDNVAGEMVGFRLPDYMGKANAPGYHFHFLTADKQAGGHVLDCQAQNVNVEIDYTSEWRAQLPNNPDFNKYNMSNQSTAPYADSEKSGPGIVWFKTVSPLLPSEWPPTANTIWTQYEFAYGSNPTKLTDGNYVTQPLSKIDWQRGTSSTTALSSEMAQAAAQGVVPLDAAAQKILADEQRVSTFARTLTAMPKASAPETLELRTYYQTWFKYNGAFLNLVRQNHTAFIDWVTQKP